MTSWLLGIVGVVFLGVLFDLVYPNGKTNAFCKSIFGVISVIMIISPILKLDFDNIDANNYIDSGLLDNINYARVENLKTQIINQLSLVGIEGVDVEIESNMVDNEFQVENIYVDTTNLVLTENVTNINKYEVISNEVAKAIQIDKERIIVYG
ncbi:MAG: hypothetical protein ACI4PF_01550 [Christensenellales bacterium]